MTSAGWELGYSSTRHEYTFNGRRTISGVGRIVSVTQVLAPPPGLAAWAARQAVAAGEAAARQWLGADDALNSSLLSFTQLASLQRAWPDNVRGARGDSGTAMHEYLAAVLRGVEPPVDCPYGLRAAVDAFMRRHAPLAVRDEQGPRVERVVGSVARGVAGTYDAQVVLMGNGAAVHRLDAKQSRSVRPEHFAQLAEYERCAVEGGEAPSEYLTVAHMSPVGAFGLYSIEVGGPAHAQALALFDAHLAVYRGAPAVAAAIKAARAW